MHTPRVVSLLRELEVDVTRDYTTMRIRPWLRDDSRCSQLLYIFLHVDLLSRAALVRVDAAVVASISMSRLVSVAEARSLQGAETVRAARRGRQQDRCARDGYSMMTNVSAGAEKGGTTTPSVAVCYSTQPIRQHS